jgi:hypothetical protein
MHRIAAAVGSIQKASPTSTPNVIDCHGLTLANLGPDRFEQELRDRQGWIEDQCQGGHQIGPLRDAEERVVGRRFHFECATEAAAFKMAFSTRL